MKRYFSYLTTAVLVLSAVLVSGCTDSDKIDNQMEGYGYVSFKLQKDTGTRADELEYLNEARKIQLTLSNDFQTISPTLLVDFFDTELSEFGLYTENLMLRAGSYSMSGYKVYDGADELIFEGAPGSDYTFDVLPDKVTVADLYLKTVLRGKIEFKLVKDFSDFTTRANSRNQEYTWDQIGDVRVELENTDDYTDRPVFTNLPTRYRVEDGTSYVIVDTTLSIKAGDYKLLRITINSKTSTGTVLETIDTFDQDVVFSVADNKKTEAEIPVKLVESDEYIKDYIALRDIWEALDGPNWSWYGESYAIGSNWDFDKDIDLWGDQPGVALHNNGRVAALTLGQFNPQGFIPAAIGQLTEITELWLGSNSDLLKGDEPSVAPGNDHIYPYEPIQKKFSSDAQRRIDARMNRGSLSLADVQGNRGEFPFRFKTGYDGHATILDYKKEESRLYRKPKLTGEFEYDVRSLRGETEVQPESRASGNVPHGKVTNGLTGIDPAIGNLTKLTTLYISNTKIKELPAEMKNLVELTDLEFYNNPLMEKFPDFLAELPNLIAVNFGKNLQWDAAEFYRGIDLLFNGASQKGLQILYADQNNLETIPPSIKNMESIGLLDFAENQLTSLTPFTMSVRPVLFYFEFNLIEEIPATDNFADWRDLEGLTLNNNRLRKFPNIFGNPDVYSLGSIDLSSNYISEVDGLDAGTFNGFITSQLDLSFNYFTKFPDLYSADTEINYLILSHNAIEEITHDDLRADYTIYTNTLDLSYNKLKKLPANDNEAKWWWATAFPWLSGLDVSGNQLNTFPTQAVTESLQIFFIMNQRDENGGRCLRAYPDDFTGRMTMSRLRVDSNDIRTATFPSTLNYLNVQDNPQIYMDLTGLSDSECYIASRVLAYDQSQSIVGCKNYIDTDVNKD